MITNRVCVNCGEKYFCCTNCEEVGSWKNYCCSRSCLEEAIKKQIPLLPKKILERNQQVKVILRGKLKDGKTISITGYDIEFGRFDCTDGVTRDTKDFETFIFTAEEVSEISKKINDLLEKTKRGKNKTEVVEEISDK